MPSAIEAVLFDLDGTLIDSEPFHQGIWNQVLDARGVAPLDDNEYARELVGKPASDNAHYLVGAYAIQARPETLVVEKETRVQAFLKHSAPPLMAYARELLQHLDQAGLRLGVVTASSRSVAEAVLRHHRLLEHLDVMISGCDSPRSKPHPDLYLLALKRLGLTAEACIAVEDSVNGIRAARSAGLQCYGLRSRYTQDTDLHLADRLIDNLNDLKSL